MLVVILVDGNLVDNSLLGAIDKGQLIVHVGAYFVKYINYIVIA
jgi:hypothetical protein